MPGIIMLIILLYASITRTPHILSYLIVGLQSTIYNLSIDIIYIYTSIFSHFFLLYSGSYYDDRLFENIWK